MDAIKLLFLKGLIEYTEIGKAIDSFIARVYVEIEKINMLMMLIEGILLNSQQDNTVNLVEGSTCTGTVALHTQGT